jgi:hypothetical protein
MKEQADILWGMYQEHNVASRHHETLRANVTSFILVVGGGIGTLVSSDGFTRADLPLSILLIFLGFFGAVFSAAHSGRYLAHKMRAMAYRDQLDALLFKEGKTLKEIKDEADEKRKKAYPRLRVLVTTHWLWLAFPIVIAILGAVLTIICLLEAGSVT